MPDQIESTRAPGPLSDIRVIEIADEIGQFCGKLMADLGADVIKIEPPGGHPTRSIGPFLNDLQDTDKSLYFWHYNTSKRSITLDLMHPEGNDIFRNLAYSADVIIETFAPGYLALLDLGYDQLETNNQDLIMCSITPFGQTGPWKNFVTSDLLHLAAGGQMASCGYDDMDIPDAPPIAPGGGNSWHTASHYAYMAIMAALLHRNCTGKGQYVDVSVHDSCALTTENAVPTYIYAGNVVRRHTGRAASPDMSEQTQFPTKDGGWVNVVRAGSSLTPSQLHALAKWMDSLGLAGDLLEERYQEVNVIENELEHINKILANFFANMPEYEAWHGGQKLGLPWGGIRTMDEILDDEHLRDRGFFVEVEHPEIGRSFTYPGSAAIFSDSPWRISNRAPLAGEHNEQILANELGITSTKIDELRRMGVI